MKKFLTFSCIVALGLAMASCTYDDSALKSDIEALKTRLASLENSYKQLSNYQTLISNIKSVTDVKDNGDGSYTISFSDNTSITLRGGQNGTNGSNGKDGVTPQFRILDGNWQVSYDKGATWETLGSASGSDLFQNVYMDGEDLILVLADGTEFRISSRPGPGNPDDPGNPGDPHGDEVTLKEMSDTWSCVLYPYGGATWLYVYEATGNYGFYAVKGDSGNFSDEGFIKGIVEEYGQKLREYYSSTPFTVLSEYSYEEFGVYNIPANESVAVAEDIARRDEGDGKYKVVMLGVSDTGAPTGEYYVITGEFAVGTVTYSNPEDAVSYGIVNMTGTTTDTWRARLYSNYVYVYRPVDETWVSFYAVPTSVDLTDASVAEAVLKEYEGLIKAFYAGGNPTINTTYASSGSFNIFSFSGADYGPHQNVVNVREGATGELQVVMIALKSDLSVSGRYAIAEGTYSN